MTSKGTAALPDATNGQADNACPSQPHGIARARVRTLKVASLSSVDWLVHGFSTRIGGHSTAYSTAGELNLGFTSSDDRANVIANRQLFLEDLTGTSGFPVVTLSQIHSSLVVRVDGSRQATDPGLAEADGMMTNEPGILLAIQTADCIPVLIADPGRRVVAAFHAGWRGTLKRIVEQGVGRMRLEFRSEPEDLIAAIGPGIGQCCYAVGEEVREEFESQFPYSTELFREVDTSTWATKTRTPSLLAAYAPRDRGAALHLDLVEANRRQLVDAGVRADAISAVQECTSCHTNRYFSYRAEGGFTGRMFSAIGIRP